MRIAFDNRAGKRTYIDRDNHQYADGGRLAKMTNIDNTTAKDVAFNLLFGNFKFTPTEQFTLRTLFDLIIEKGFNEVREKEFIEYCSKRMLKGERTFTRCITKFIELGIISSRNGYIKFVDYCNPMMSDLKSADYIIIEVCPAKTSKELKYDL